MTSVSRQDGQRWPRSQLVTLGIPGVWRWGTTIVVFLRPASQKPTEQVLCCAFEFGGGGGPERSTKERERSFKRKTFLMSSLNEF